MSIFGKDEVNIIQLEKLDRTLHPDGTEDPPTSFDPDSMTMEELAEFEELARMSLEDGPPPPPDSESINPDDLERLDQENVSSYTVEEPEPQSFLDRIAKEISELCPPHRELIQQLSQGYQLSYAMPFNQPAKCLIPEMTQTSVAQAKRMIETSAINTQMIQTPVPRCDSISPTTKKEALTDQPTPYHVAQALLRAETFLVSGNATMRYNGKYYQAYTVEDMKRFITGRCRAAVALAGNANFVEQVYKCLAVEPNICTDDILQPSPDHVNFEDGILDLRTGEFGPHTPKIFTNSMLKASFMQGCDKYCPAFDQFIYEIALGNPVLIQYIWEVLGCLLTQDLRDKHFYVFQGYTASGKSVLGNFIRNCCTPSSICSLDLHSFGKNFALGSLIGKRLCVDLDLSSGAINPASASILKKLTGGDLLSADIKYMPRVTFANSAQLLFASNHAIYTKEPDQAFERRCVAVPFQRSVPPTQQDPLLPQKLEKERDHVIVKALRYYRRYRQNGYTFSGNFAANAVIQQDGNLDDMIFQFLQHYCCIEEGHWISTQELFSCFSNIFGAVCKPKTFAAKLTPIAKMLYPAVKSNERSRIQGKANPVYGYTGIRIITS